MISQKRFFVSVITATLLGGGIALGSYHSFFASKPDTIVYESAQVQQPVHLATLANANEAATPNLVHAAQMATPAVVHIKATYETKGAQIQRGKIPLDELLKEFFGQDFSIGPREQKNNPQQTAGSGVIIGADGYVVTNNHVIDGADQIEVTLDDNRRYTAKLIGQDPNTDLALLKIKEKGLPYLLFGNSDALQVGEWVLAVGNPFNLTSTVTKGIVSAKGRNINLQNNGVGIESFIQTDAAVNSGNSGGALVNLQGELVGINTAISAPTGTFAGYAFAIPSSLVKKITDDLKKYGTVQRGMLGVYIQDVNADLAKEKGLKQLSGVYIKELTKASAAAKAGLKAGDVIVAINGNKVKSASALQEQVARYKPLDKLSITFYRKAKEKTVTVVLERQESENEIAGATFEDLQQIAKGPDDVRGRVHIKSLKKGPWQAAGIKPGFVLTAIDNEPVKQTAQLKGILERKKKAFLVDGFYPNGQAVSYAVGWGQQ
ncbi:MAG: Do family serine endopeptidase [Bacteroidota bacterium]